jgi:signal transduction histidine kinase
VRTPLNSLIIGIDLLEYSENFDETDRESLLMMKGASEFMSDTLNDVLNMQKIEEGKMELDLSPFSMQDAVSKVLIPNFMFDLHHFLLKVTKC